MLKIVVCVSGGGTNLQAVIDGIKQNSIQNTEIIAVISNNQTAYALERAKKEGIPAQCISPKEYTDRELFNQALCYEMEKLNPDLIVLAGFLVNIPAEMVKAFPNRIINIHPSLIPSFCGVGYYGLKVHEAVLQRGVKITGATVHFVDEDTDTGPILLQQAVEVRREDNAESLQKRVMEQAEWVILPKAIDLISAGRVSIENGKAVITE